MSPEQRERKNARNRAHRAANPGKYAEYWRKYYAAKRAANPEKVAEYWRAHRAANREKKLIDGARKRAKKLGLPFDLTVENIVWNQFCPLCPSDDCLLDYLTPRSGKRLQNGPSLDRVIPDCGYVASNVRVICNKCNSQKSDAAPEFNRRLAAYFEASVSP